MRSHDINRTGGTRADAGGETFAAPNATDGGPATRWAGQAGQSDNWLYAGKRKKGQKPIEFFNRFDASVGHRTLRRPSTPRHRWLLYNPPHP